MCVIDVLQIVWCTNCVRLPQHSLEPHHIILYQYFLHSPQRIRMTGINEKVYSNIVIVPSFKNTCTSARQRVITPFHFVLQLCQFVWQISTYSLTLSKRKLFLFTVKTCFPESLSSLDHNYLIKILSFFSLHQTSCFSLFYIFS